LVPDYHTKYDKFVGEKPELHSSAIDAAKPIWKRCDRTAVDKEMEHWRLCRLSRQQHSFEERPINVLAIKPLPQNVENSPIFESGPAILVSLVWKVRDALERRDKVFDNGKI
jgi:hypothetical protein